MITITSPYSAYATDGSQTQFDITFEYKAGDPLDVILAEPVTEEEQILIAGTHYVVEGSDTLGWAIRTIDVYPVGYDLYLIRDMPQVQESDYVENDPLPAGRLEGDYDSAVKMLQEVKRFADRSLKLRQTSGLSNVEMADPVDGSILKYDAWSGRYEAVKALDLVNLTILTFMEGFLEAVDYEEARVGLGADADWHEIGEVGEPAFENGWTNSSDVDDATLAFRLDSSGYVHLKGRAVGGIDNTTIFTLPSDYRPVADQQFTVPSLGGHHQIKVKSTGEVLDVVVSSGATLPTGTILMYNGTGIANTGSRSSKLGDDGGDTITDIPSGDWYVCNGNASTPNLLNKFIRAESASGNTGGSDDAIVVTHGHGKTANQDTSHGHQYWTYVSPNVQNLRNEPAGYTGAYAERYRQSRNTGNQNASHKHTVNDAGSSGTGKNIPAYYSLIFIIRMA